MKRGLDAMPLFLLNDLLMNNFSMKLLEKSKRPEVSIRILIQLQEYFNIIVTSLFWFYYQGKRRCW